MRYFSARHDTIAVDLPGHGSSPGTPADARIETLGAAVADLLERLDVAPAVLVGHSMGCRVIVEAMRAAPTRVVGLVLVDGSRFALAGSDALTRLRETVSTADGYATTLDGMFRQMFLADADPALVASIVGRARQLPHAFGSQLLPALVAYDGAPFEAAYGAVRVPMLVVQSTWTDPERRRVPLHQGQNTPYFDDLRRLVGDLTIEIVENVGHFPQIERASDVDGAIARFLERCRVV